MSEKGADRDGRERGHAAQGSGLDRPIELLEDKRASREDARAAGGLRGQRARSSVEKLLTRTMSGVVYAALTLACVLLGPLPTTLLISAEAWLCCSELFRICRMGGRMPNELLGLAAAALLPLAAWYRGLLACTLVVFVLLMSCACWYVSTPRANIADVSVTMFGPLYTSLAFASIVLVRKADASLSGAWLTLGIMLSIWANDALAYLVGSAVGTHRLAPRISPHKSVEGFVGGLVGSVSVWVALSLLVTPQLSVAHAALLGLVVGLAAVVGDLFESRLKRGVGVKDSGNLIPGHGGLLDRSDSMLFGSMAAYFLLLFGGVL